VEIPDLDEAAQLSFSNPMNINRGVTSHEQARSILEEYQKRKKANQSFAEWFSIDPPFPAGAFGDEKLVPGAYCNGGIMPLVGGELARAYLESGFEKEGVDTLLQYHGMIADKDETYLWYFPDGSASSVETSTSPDAMPTDGWGSSSMLFGFMEGLVGVQDQGCMMDAVKISPRWVAASLSSAEVSVGYAASGACLEYAYRERTDGISLDIETVHTAAQIHLLLPEGAQIASVSNNGDAMEFTESSVENSRYADCQLIIDRGTTLDFKFK
jgi:hypothetical protein